MNDRGQRALLDGTGKLENIVPFEEKGALFRKKERITQIDIDLTGIGLDLTEIRVVSAIQGQIRCQADFSCQGEIRLFFICLHLAFGCGLECDVG